MYAHKKVTGARSTLTTLYRTLRILLPANCGSTMHPAHYVVASGQFFFLLSVWSP
jgi:hypothetical protein